MAHNPNVHKSPKMWRVVCTLLLQYINAITMSVCDYQITTLHVFLECDGALISS